MAQWLISQVKTWDKLIRLARILAYLIIENPRTLTISQCTTLICRIKTDFRGRQRADRVWRTLAYHCWKFLARQEYLTSLIPYSRYEGILQNGAPEYKSIPMEKVEERLDSLIQVILERCPYGLRYQQLSTELFTQPCGSPSKSQQCVSSVTK